MNTSPSPVASAPARAMRAWYERGMVWIELADGRQIGVPTTKFPRLRNASDHDLAKVRVEARGKALRWEELDEDLLVEGIVAGRFPAACRQDMNNAWDIPVSFRRCEDGSLTFESPYHSCSECKYVGTEIDFEQSCPVCGHRVTDALSVWPNVQWIGAASDIAFLYEHKKLELLTIALAAYFEGVLWAFFYDAFLLIHAPTRSVDIDVSHVADEGERFVAEQQEFRRRQKLINDMLNDKKFRAWGKRLKELCTKVFGRPFDELLAEHVPNAKAFITNRDNIHEWRNLILHRGIPLDQVWPDKVRNAAPRIAIEFVQDCWDTFRILNNELIHKPYWTLRQPPKPTHGTTGGGVQSQHP